MAFNYMADVTRRLACLVQDFGKMIGFAMNEYVRLVRRHSESTKSVNSQKERERGIPTQIPQQIHLRLLHPDVSQFCELKG